MKSLSNKTRYLILLGSLLLVILFSGVSLPGQSVPGQAELSPTPTAEKAEQFLESGDTEELILGAGVILIIILGGVFIQRMIIKNANPKTPESE
jgi:hypothetical protein